MAFDLEAAEQIRQQKAKYCRYVDTKQFDAWEGIFKPDAKITFYNLDNSVMAEFNSIAELSAMSRRLFANAQTIHQTHNSEIEFKSATEATAIWSMEDWHIYAAKDGNPSKTMHGYGFYHEKWERINNDWRLARLELRRNILTHT
ncbi:MULTISPECIES: nuclear transport factor 2 family protein [Burkholderia]|uniref:Bile acid 7-alpha dehydratase n=1 Tax=Burkholderia aenigmatica TaxID=2015348 RepID=A0A6J5IWI3_9BURK|nr:MULTISPECIES: nuclear transport factor 2 family protein [Burkholderia]UKD16840.1 nuclear transport factor 2 family protein [Burkholderia aenigmatica]CAB3962252.1 bile acid 7-alpha dehydratase [Burkholderia aenigmatica]